MLIRRRQLCMTQKLFKKLLTSEDKRRELQEIPTAEPQQFAIKFVQSFCLCNFFLKKITRWLEKINLFPCGERQYFTNERNRSKIRLISSRRRIISSIHHGDLRRWLLPWQRMAGMETRLKIYQPVVKCLCACDSVNVQSTGSTW